MTTTARGPRIRLAPPEEVRRIEASAPPDLREHLRLATRELAQVPGAPDDALYRSPLLRALALRPEILRSWCVTEHHAVKRGAVDSRAKELLGLAIAARVCGAESAPAAHRAAAARYEGATEHEVAAVLRDGERAGGLDLFVRDVIAFGFTVALRPAEVTAQDVDRLRGHGLEDAALVEIASAALVAYALAAVGRALAPEGAGA